MSDTVIQVENLSKLYRLGEVGTGTLSHDLNRWWAKARGKEDPFTKVGHINDRTQKAGKEEYVWVLNDINFEVKRGEVLGIIGKNGAGKSTLLKILSEITAPTQGEIRINGRVASLLEVGTGFHPELTGRENVFLNGAILGMTKTEIKRKFDEIMDFAGCEKYADTPVKRYSSGMTVRLGFAIAAFLEPEILIVDEVLAVGDAEFQKKAIGKMKDVSRGGERTVLFVSHNMASIQTLCTSTLILQNGQMSFIGDVSKGVTQYLNSNIQNTQTHLSQRKDRAGNGLLLFTNIEIIDHEGVQLFEIQSGIDISIKLTYTAKKDLYNVIFRMQIVNEEGILMFICNNYLAHDSFSILSSEGEAVCRIPKFPLPLGTYYIHLHAYGVDGLLDEIDFAKELKVNGGDFFGTGKIPNIKGGVYVNHSWELPQSSHI